MARNLCERFGEILKDQFVRKPDETNTRRLDQLLPLWIEVHATIDLHGKTLGRTVEVQHKRPDRLLLPELPAMESLPS